VLHPPDDDGPKDGEHRWRIDQGVEGLGLELRRAALVDVEVPRGRIDRALEQCTDRLLFQDVFLAVEIVDGIGHALL